MSDLFVIEDTAINWEESIKKCFDQLYMHGCVKEDFYISCVDREKKYPTGLTSSVPVALPHTSKDHVLKEAICVLRLKEPVKFRSMEDTEKEIDVSVVVNMALLDDSEHIVIISKIINHLKDNKFIEDITTLPINELKSYLMKTIM